MWARRGRASLATGGSVAENRLNRLKKNAETITGAEAEDADGMMEPEAAEDTVAAGASADDTTAGAPSAEAVTPPTDAVEQAGETATAAGAKTGTGEAPTEDEEPEDEVEYVEERVVVMRRGPFVALTAIGALLIVGLAAFGLYQWKKPAPAVAVVNGSTISRADYDKAVASANGQQVLDDLISQRLVSNDAAKKKVSVNTDEVDAKLKEIKKQFPADTDYRQALDTQHLTEIELRDRIRNSLLLQKLAGSTVQVSDQEIQQAFDQGKDTQYQGKTLDDVKSSIKDDLTQQKQQEAGSSYLDNLKKTAKISQHLPGQSKS